MKNLIIIILYLIFYNLSNSSVANLEIKNQPGCPSGIAPGGILVSLLPLMDWTDVRDANCYHLQISRYANFSLLELDAVIKKHGDTLKSEYQLINELQPLTFYHWRIEAGDDSGYGGYCMQYSFFTGG